MEFWRYFWFYTKLSHGKMIFVLIYSLLAMVLQTFGLAMIALAMEFKLETSEISNPIIAKLNMWIHQINFMQISNHYLYIVALTAFSFAMVSWILFMVELYVNKISTRMGAELQSTAGEMMLKTHSIFFERESIGNLNNVVTIQTMVVAEGFRRYIQLIIAFFAIAPFFIGAIIVNPFWILVLMTVVVIPIALIMRGVAWNTYQLSREQAHILSEKNGFLLQMINAHQYIKSVGAEKSIIQQYRSYVKAFFSTVQKLNFWVAIGNHLLMGILVIILCCVIFIQTEYQKSSIIAGSVTMAFLYGMCLKSVGFFTTYQKFLSVLGGVQLYETMVHRMRRNIEVNDASAETLNFRESSEIVFDDISAKFNYRTGALFEGLSFSIPIGKMTLISGNSDALKSTLIQMISGIIPPMSGGILLDEKLIERSNIAHLRKQIGYLPETPRFFSGSLYENLTLFTQGIRYEELLPILDQMGLLPVINALPEGIDTKMLDHAAHFTPGEVRAFAITRELIMANDVLLIDHPSSHWNPTQIDAFFATLKRFATQKTVIIVSEDPRLLPYIDHHQLV